jgi:hypothetical protein
MNDEYIFVMIDTTDDELVVFIADKEDRTLTRPEQFIDVWHPNIPK